MEMEIKREKPEAAEYNKLRQAAGLPAREEGSVNEALGRSIVTVVARNEAGRLIGMGRSIGDGVFCFQAVDMIADPAFRAEEILLPIMNEMTGCLKRSVPEGAQLIVMANLQEMNAYKKLGFELTYPNALSMSKTL